MTTSHSPLLLLKPMGGRYPFALARYCPANIRASLRRQGDKVVLRIDDVSNHDRWEEFVVSTADLASLLQGVDQVRDALSGQA